MNVHSLSNPHFLRRLAPRAQLPCGNPGKYVLVLFPLLKVAHRFFDGGKLHNKTPSPARDDRGAGDKSGFCRPQKGTSVSFFGPNPPLKRWLRSGECQTK